jgi:effector-binding domain-containing protein
MQIELKTIKKHQKAFIRCKGPYGEAASVYSDLFRYAAENKLQIVGPVTEIYLNNPYEIPEGELLIEVQFPVVNI